MPQAALLSPQSRFVHRGCQLGSHVFALQTISRLWSVMVYWGGIAASLLRTQGSGHCLFWRILQAASWQILNQEQKRRKWLLKTMNFSELFSENDLCRLFVSLQASQNANRNTQPNFLTVTSAFKRHLVLLRCNEIAVCCPPVLAPFAGAATPDAAALPKPSRPSSGEGVWSPDPPGLGRSLGRHC